MAHLLDNPEHWRDLAEEMRTHAAEMRDPEATRIVLGIAESYDRLVRLAEEHAATRRESKPPPHTKPGTAFAVNVEGAVHHGTYEINGGVITVHSGVWGRSAPLGKHADAPKAFAELMLADAVRSGAIT